MYNPVILKKDGPFEAEEGCLSLSGVRKTVRYQNVEDEILDRFGVEVKVQAAEKVTLTFKRKKGEDGKWKDYKANFYCYKADGRWYALIRDSER